MLHFELKKILMSRVNQIAMILGIVLFAIVYFSQNFGSDSIYCEETDSYLTGMDAMRYAKEKAAGQGDYLTEEVVEKYLQEMQDYPGDLNSDDAYVEIFRKNGSLIYFLSYSYFDIEDTLLDFNLIKEIDLTDGPHFYRRRIEKINHFLDMDFSYGNYTEAEKAFWNRKAQQVKEPFKWGAKAPASRMSDLISVMFYLLAVVIICIAPMFSKEIDTGAAQLLLTTKEGKTGLVRAKVGAAMLFTVGYLLGTTLIAALIQGLTNGFAEMELPVQIWNNAIPFAMSMGQACLLHILLILVIATTLVVIMLFTSAITKSTIGTMGLALVFLIVPAFIPYSKNSGLFNHLLDLTFVRFANLLEAMGRFVDYAFGNLIFDQFTFAMMVWIALTILLLLPLRRIFVNRIVHES